MTIRSTVGIHSQTGVGKTTLVRKACDALVSSCSAAVDGFYTEEVRAGGRRVGFDVVTAAAGERAPLSRIRSGDQIR